MFSVVIFRTNTRLYNLKKIIINIKRMMTQGKRKAKYEVDRKITLSVVNRLDLVIDINIILYYVGVSD